MVPRLQPADSQPPQRVARGRLHLDDVRPHIGQHAGGCGHKGPHRHFDDLYPGQRPVLVMRCHLGSSPAVRIRRFPAVSARINSLFRLF